jgi:secretion/DNA translocation related CpaE-like protein
MQPRGGNAAGREAAGREAAAGHRPLLVTGDQVLLDELLRLAAAAGAVPEVVADPADVGDVRRLWAATPLVLVGDDCAGALAALRLPRRDGVLLLDRGTGSGVWERAVHVGAEQVCSLPADRDVVADLMGACTDGPAGAPVVCVVGGCGGAGASVFAAALAAAAAGDGSRSLLVDADSWGGGLDLLLGGEHVAGVRWSDLAATTGRVSAPSLRDLLPTVHRLSVLSWERGNPVPVSAASMRAVVTAGQRGHDLVVVDLPRRFDAAAEEALVRATLTVLVVPCGVRAVAAATPVVGALTRLAGALGLVVRGPGACGVDASVVADSLGVPLLAAMRPEPRLNESLDQGLGPLRRRRGPLGRACSRVLGVVLEPEGVAA